MRDSISSIYIHIPFCRDKCIYCDFYSIRAEGDEEMIREYIGAVKDEFLNYLDYLQEGVETVYIGGGTPSVISESLIEDLLSFLISHIKIKTDFEFTFEINPESVQERLLSILKTYGVNRISLGVQSLDDNVLKRLKRVHTANRATKSLESIYNAGFENVGVDLLIGADGDTDAFLGSVEWLLDRYPLKHLSAYILTIDESKKGRETEWLKDIDEGEIVGQYTGLHNLLAEREFIHYEISNYAKRGFESRHNLNYWRCGHYIGLGASAAGYLRDENGKLIRYKNLSDVKRYIANIRSGEGIYSEYEQITTPVMINEKIMLAMRTSSGVSISELEGLLGKRELNNLLKKARYLESEGLIEIKEGRLIPTLKGFIMNNLVLREMMI